MGIQDVRYAMGWPGSGNTRREWYEGLVTGSGSTTRESWDLIAPTLR